MFFLLLCSCRDSILPTACSLNVGKICSFCQFMHLFWIDNHIITYNRYYVKCNFFYVVDFKGFCICIVIQRTLVSSFCWFYSSFFCRSLSLIGDPTLTRATTHPKNGEYGGAVVHSFLRYKIFDFGNFIVDKYSSNRYD